MLQYEALYSGLQVPYDDLAVRSDATQGLTGCAEREFFDQAEMPPEDVKKPARRQVPNQELGIVPDACELVTVRAERETGNQVVEPGGKRR